MAGIGVGLPIIRTARCLLRPFTAGDVDALHELWTAPEVRQYLWDDIVITREVAAQVVNSHIASAASHGIGFWAIHAPPPLSPDGAPVAGFCGFRFIDDGPEIELLYGLHGEHWGTGLATHASLAAIRYLWRSTAFPHVYARTDPPNERSVAVMRRLGMTPESTTGAMITGLLRRLAEIAPAVR
jgi:RimJ/RimL family protein N-acetyltransferase